MKGQQFEKDLRLPLVTSRRSRLSPRTIGTERRPGGGALLSIVPRAAKEIVICLLLVAGQSFFFSLEHRLGPWLIFLSMPSGLGLGLLWYALAGPERLLHDWLTHRLDRVLACFGLFFFHLVFYILLFSLTVSYPMGLLIGTLGEGMDLGRQYMIYSLNPVFVLVAGSLFRWWRTAGRHNS